jgi:DNA processing protein
MRTEVLDFLILSLADGLGCRSANRLLETYPSPASILAAPPAELIGHSIPEFVVHSLQAQETRRRAELELGKCLQNGIQLLVQDDPEYPKLLKEIYDPPIILFVKGEVKCLNTPAVAIVGSRRATPYGLNTAERLARDLASRGVMICSGLARGIDTAAHRGALEARGVTSAVLGSGLNVIYPKENKRLAQQIEERGCVVSEFPLNVGPVPQNSPIRNRIISGLCLGVCLVEAAEFSGSLITARMALEQGREVFAIPGNITSRNSFGPNLWIKQGAKLVQDWQDIVEEFPQSLKEFFLFNPQEAKTTGEKGLTSGHLTEAEKTVLKWVPDDEAIHIDRLLDLTRMNSGDLLSALLELEMKDKIKQLPGKSFLKKY